MKYNAWQGRNNYGKSCKQIELQEAPFCLKTRQFVDRINISLAELLGFLRKKLRFRLVRKSFKITRFLSK
jgi:hypothetical protein